MIPIPICLKSKTHCHSICMSYHCKQSPFMCSECDNQYCINIHKHSQKLQKIFWNEINSLIQKHFQPDKIPQSKQSFGMIKNQSSAQNNNNQIVDQLKNKKYEHLTGKDMRIFYEYLLQVNQKKQAKLLAEKYFRKGRERFDKYKYQKAFFDFQKVVELDKNFHDAYEYLMELVKILGKQKQFIYCNSDEIQYDPTYSVPYYKRGRAFYQLRLHAEALNDFNMAIQLDPDYEVAYFSRAIIYFHQKQQDKILPDYNKAIELNPRYHQAYSHRGYYYHLNNQLQKALNDFNKAIELNPQYANAYFNRGIFYFGKNEMLTALQDYNKYISLKHHDQRAYYNRGVIYFNINKIQEASRDFIQCLSLQKDYHQCYFYLAKIELKKKKDLKLGLIYIQNAIIICKFLQYYIYRGIIYDCLQEEQQANNSYAIGFSVNEDITYNLKLIYKQIKNFKEEEGKIDKINP